MRWACLALGLVENPAGGRLGPAPVGNRRMGSGWTVPLKGPVHWHLSTLKISFTSACVWTDTHVSVNVTNNNQQPHTNHNQPQPTTNALLLLRMLTGPIQQYQSAIFQAWQLKNSAQLADRKRFWEPEFLVFLDLCNYLTLPTCRKEKNVVKVQ